MLLVDDEPTICEVVRDFLEDEPGTTVACATTGEEGAQAIRFRRFDVALLDVMIPGLSGLALAEMAVAADLPVLLLSGHPLINDTLSTFGWPYMPKPFELAALRTRLEHEVAQARANMETVKASAARMRAAAGELKIAMADTQRILAEIKAHWPAGKPP